MDVNLSTLWEIVKDRGTWHAAVHGVTEWDMTEQLNNKGRGKEHLYQFCIFFQEQSHINIFVFSLSLFSV